MEKKFKRLADKCCVLGNEGIGPADRQSDLGNTSDNNDALSKIENTPNRREWNNITRQGRY